VTSAVSNNTTSISVTFDAPPNPGQAQTLANYSVPGLTLSGTPTLAGNTVSVSALGITNGMLAADAVTTGKILDGTITAADLAGNISITTTGTFTGNGSGLTNLTGANVTGAVPSATTAISFSGTLAGDVIGTQGATVIASNSVTSAKILDGTIAGNDLSNTINIFIRTAFEFFQSCYRRAIINVIRQSIFIGINRTSNFINHNT
jgi:hypothetical protein